MGKNIILIVFIILCISFVGAVNYKYQYNPYTAKLDRTISLNQTGDNFTVDYIFGDGSQLTGIVPYTGAVNDVNLGSHDLIVDTDTLFVDSTNDRVGIGTTTPDAKLKVTIPAGSAKILSEENYGLILRGNDYISRMWIDGANSATIDLDRGSASKTCAHQFRTAGAIDWIFGIADSDVVGLDGTEFFIGQTSGGIGADMIIKTDGKIGIGTISPSQTLSVVGTLNVTSWTYTAGEYKCDNGTHTIRSRNKTLLNNMGCSI